MAVFETVRLVAGRAQFWELHAERLKAAALQCGFTLAESALVSARDCIATQTTSGVARIYVTAGDGGPTEPVRQSRIALLLEERQRVLPDAYHLRLCPGIHLPLFEGLKTANYWDNANSLREAHLHGANEALLSNPEGLVIGGCMANVFLHTPATGWITPKLSTGARRGVVRQWAIEKLPVREADIRAAALHEVDAGFLTSSWIGIMPAGSLSGRPLHPRTDILELRQVFEKLPLPADSAAFEVG